MNGNPDEPLNANGECGSDSGEAEAIKVATSEAAARAERFATISRLNPGGMTGDARKINKQKLAFEGR